MDKIYGQLEVMIPNRFYLALYSNFSEIEIGITYEALLGDIKLISARVPFEALDIIDWSKPLLKPYLMDAARNNLNTTLEELDEVNHNVYCKDNNKEGVFHKID